jgi:hypothetical protein
MQGERVEFVSQPCSELPLRSTHDKTKQVSSDVGIRILYPEPGSMSSSKELVEWVPRRKHA